MPENAFSFTAEELEEWHTNLEMANKNNIFCHCRTCGAEWVDSSDDVPCPKCGSKDIESISCWQFPDG